MFSLTDEDLRLRILGSADGPASFNAEATRQGIRVVSCDPIYRFTRVEIQDRIAATYDEVLEQTRQNAHEFVWGGAIQTIEDLGRVRMASMTTFLEDYDSGKAKGRYVAAELPPLPFDDRAFDLALCSHFLFLYSSHLDEAFHLDAIREMSRVATDVRIFPLLTLNGEPSPFVDVCSQNLTEAGYEVAIETVAYEFQRGGNRMMRVRAKA